jgi:hypothetical protein
MAETTDRGFTLIGGLRYDLSRSERVATSIVVETGLRTNGSLDPSIAIPLMASFQVTAKYSSAR